ncbi:hypothetical protein [Kibdelosporangium aridum]|nr:hypothetical protein [Kibdelosporangium aridum]
MAGDLAAENGVLVPEREKFGVLGGVTAEQQRRDGQELAGQLV